MKAIILPIQNLINEISVILNDITKNDWNFLIDTLTNTLHDTVYTMYFYVKLIKFIYLNLIKYKSQLFWI